MGGENDGNATISTQPPYQLQELPYSVRIQADRGLVQHEYAGGFARTIRTQEAKNLTLIHTEIQTIHSQHLAVAFGQAPGGDDTLFCFTSRLAWDVKQNRVSSPPGA